MHFFLSEIPCNSEEDGLFCSQEIQDGSGAGDYDNDWLNIYNESTPGNCEEPNCDTSTSAGGNVKKSIKFCVSDMKKKALELYFHAANTLQK